MQEDEENEPMEEQGQPVKEEDEPYLDLERG
jgi:hypothetical protein